jgi:PKD repeat protein
LFMVQQDQQKATPENVDVTFTDQSTGDLVKWAWDFGDGGTSEEQNPVHQYAAGGVFDVSLTVTDTEDRTNTVTIEGLITIGRITTDFSGGPRTGGPRTVGFENLTVGIVDTYLWDFGDGETSDEFEPEHDYGPGDTPPTDYTVKLTASGPVNTDMAEKVDYITVDDYPAVVADFEPDTKTLPIQGEYTVEFVNKSTGAETYVWDFDYLANPGVDTSEEKDPIWTFENDTAGDRDFTVRLTATGPGPNESDFHEEIYTLNEWEPANAQFDAVTRVGPKPLVVQFLNTSTYSISWVWDFDFVGNPGEHTSTDRHPTHIYEDAGWYTVKLIATPPGEGADDQETKTDFIHVEDTGPPGRVTDGLQAEYHFNEGSESAVEDVSEVGSPLNLTILEQAKTTWGDGGYLTIDDGVVIESNDVAAKIIDACKISNELTLEAWVTRGATVKDGLEHWVAGIMSVETPWQRNCGMGEVPDNDKMASRIRTAGTGNVGGPAESDSGALLDAKLIHMVVTRASGGATKLYQNGVEIKEVAGDAGTFSSWDETYKLILVNHHNGNNPWLGSLHLVAVYSKALSLAEVEQNYSFGGETPIEPPGPPKPPECPDPTHWVSSGQPTAWNIPTGDDDGDGSEIDPWLTLKHAVGQLVPGMVLGVQGNFHERLDLNWMYRNGQKENRIYIVGVKANGHKAEVDGQYSLPAGSDSAVDCPTGNLEHTYSPLVKVGIKDGGGKGDYTTIQNLVIMQSRGRGINIESTDGFHLIDVDIKETRAGSFRANAGNNNVIRNVTTYHSSNYCPQQRAAGIGAPWPHSLIAQYETNIQFENCVATEPYGEGMGMHNCTDSNFVNCESHGSNNTGISINAGVNSKIVGCYISFLDSLKPATGISISGEGGETVGGYTGMKRDTDGVLVANNIIYGASFGIRIRNQSLDWGQFNISVYHNTVIAERPPKLNPEKWVGGRCVLIRRPSNDRGYKAVDIRNNLYIGVNADEDIAKGQMIHIASMDKKWLDAFTFSHNWWSHRPLDAKAISPQDKFNGAGVAKTSLDLPQVPEDAEVKFNCSAIGAGRNLLTALRPVIDDYWGTARPSNPTMGAHEPTDE